MLHSRFAKRRKLEGVATDGGVVQWEEPPYSNVTRVSLDGSWDLAELKEIVDAMENPGEEG